MENISVTINRYISDNRISKSALARNMGMLPKNLIGRLKNTDMTVAFVQQVSKALDHNFFEYLVEHKQESENESLRVEITILEREKKMLLDIIDKRIK